jgi:hypothetical protein
MFFCYLTPSDYDDRPSFQSEAIRRHSVAGPLIDRSIKSSRFAASSASSSVKDAVETAPKYKDVNDYFENKEHRTKAWVEAGKNLESQQTPTAPGEKWPLYVVEFKYAPTF